MKRRSTTVILVIMIAAGLSLLLYPSFADWWNRFHGAQLIAAYDDKVNQMEADKIDAVISAADEYNSRLSKNGQVMELSGEKRKDYESQLCVPDTDVIGYIEINKIHVNLPIFHGTSENVLKNGIGHMEWSSLPVGGKSTHCVLSGHRGLPSAKLFTDIVKLKEGDFFVLNVLGRRFTYEVDQIRTVLPQDTTELMIEKDKDYCTLVTCTPYGVNTHRLLVRGHRVKNAYDERVVNEAIRINPVYVASAMTITIMAVLASFAMERWGRKSKKKKESREK